MTDEYGTGGQKRALNQLGEIERRTDDFEIVSVNRPSEERKSLYVSVSIRTGHLDCVNGGLPLHERERLLICVPPEFPFDRPRAWSHHTRFAGRAHVQWKRYLCLYVAPGVEWNPSDGMYGFIDRLWEWLRRGALGQLDETGAPLHPPVTYASSDAPLVIPRADTPAVSDEPWFGLARLHPRGEHRTDVTEWEPFSGDDEPDRIAAAVLLPSPMPFEFPERAGGLFRELADRDAPLKRLLPLLLRAVSRNPKDAPLYLLVGAPMRGVRGSGDLKQHITAWRLDETAAKSLRLSLGRYSEDERIREIGEEALDIFFDWANSASVEWCKVREDRSEIVTRRDRDASLSVFQGKTISIWGCGALGAHIALCLARAGVSKLILRDEAKVSPGVLVRQPYDDADIGRPKVEALSDKLTRIRPGLNVDALQCDVIDEVLDPEGNWTGGADAIIDCTASRTVRCKLEWVRRSCDIRPVPAISMLISSNATRGMVVLASEHHSGGPADVFHKASIRACTERSLNPFAEAFYPENGDDDLFQPEPGCSSPTFVGSAADASALAGMMLNCAAGNMGRSINEWRNQKTGSGASSIDLYDGSTEAFSYESVPTAWAHFVTQPHAADEREQLQAKFSWPPDLVSPDPRRGYEIRIQQDAWQPMRMAVGQSKRERGPDVETGGLLYGRRDDAAKVIWIDDASGPPPDSRHHRDFFVCGTSGTQSAHRRRKTQTRGAIRYVGMWHTHPHSAPSPSKRDLEGMRNVLSETNLAPSRALLTIIGTPHDAPAVGTYVFDRTDVDSFTGIPAGGAQNLPAASRSRTGDVPSRDIGLALSGGGARAVAFHLGCLRALHDLGLLRRVRIMSAVSGGAVITAMYAYSTGSFSTFEKRVVQLLQDGLQADLVRRALLSRRGVEATGTLLSAGALAYGAQVVRAVASTVHDLASGGSRAERPIFLDRLKAPLPRWRSRLTAFKDVLDDRLFEGKAITDPVRDGIEVVLNAADLRSGAAFRFGNERSAIWRYGYVDGNDVDVATAVAASAAYPAFLPAMHEAFMFVDRDGEANEQQVVLTDGGVFDNLGASCLEPGRDERYSYHVHDCDHLICCSAGHGQWAGIQHPYGWKARMERAVGLLLKKQQDGMKRRLFNHRAHGALDSLVFPFLGQRDEKLEGRLGASAIPNGFITRNQVVGYPTDFRAMPAVDIERLTKRGEQLTHMLNRAYGPRSS